MKTTLTKAVVLLLVLLLKSVAVEAQETKNPFKVNLSEDGKKYIKFGANFQLWARYTELNPNSKVGDNIVANTTDIVLRRLRLQAMGMLTENVFFHIQLGQNNINFTQNSGPSNAPLSLLDAIGEYHFNDKFHLGGGLTAWGAGTTRYSANSSSSQLTLDAPIYQQNINVSSTFGNRNLSIYAKGIFDKLSYRVAITNPYRNATSTLNLNSTISTHTPKAQYSGLLTYQFADKESNTEPYNKGTYLGTKKIFNIGLGYLTQSKAMWRLDPADATTLIYEDMSVVGLDVFYDKPVSAKGDALTLYAAYNNCNLGKNYTRSIATPDPAIVDTSLLNGSGNGFIGVGTGNIYYGQVGYLFAKPKNAATKGRLQVYAAGQIADLEALSSPMSLYELGANYYLTGTLGPKLSLGYQNRSIFEKTGVTYPQAERKSMVMLQFQISF
ncbi:porin family protein [Flavobacterium muglaense]|uniref:Porin n=1 Tax=Flavobacterium muglaense TaxID=2764716 RepID=A0A923N5A4_9FLAO|nr:hypothetical protein [Flavobacterium muglaense]MBC5839360.1 hypothetical protein [Flavobacterium muglaense]MBC5845888.1 hypothetical protein [Flavobacterium muglaense]